MTSNRHDLDRLITQVAGDMTAVEPGHLGTRVRAAIESPARVRWTWRVPALVGLMGCAAIVLAVVWTADVHSALQIAQDSAASLPRPGMGATSSTPDAGVVLRAATEAILAASVVRRTTRRPRTAAPPQVSTAEREWLTRTVPALSEAVPLSVSDIEPPGLQFPVLSIEPLGAGPVSKTTDDRAPGSRL